MQKLCLFLVAKSKSRVRRSVNNDHADVMALLPVTKIAIYFGPSKHSTPNAVICTCVKARAVDCACAVASNDRKSFHISVNLGRSGNQKQNKFFDWPKATYKVNVMNMAVGCYHILRSSRVTLDS